MVWKGTEADHLRNRIQQMVPGEGVEPSRAFGPYLFERYVSSIPPPRPDIVEARQVRLGGL